MLEPHRSNLNVEMIGGTNKRFKSIGCLRYTNTFIIQTELNNVALRVPKACSTSETRNLENAFLYIPLLQIPPTNTARRMPGWCLYLRKHRRGTKDSYSTSLLGRRFHIGVRFSFANPWLHKSSTWTGHLLSIWSQVKSISTTFQSVLPEAQL